MESSGYKNESIVRGWSRSSQQRQQMKKGIEEEHERNGNKNLFECLYNRTYHLMWEKFAALANVSDSPLYLLILFMPNVFANRWSPIKNEQFAYRASLHKSPSLRLKTSTALSLSCPFTSVRSLCGIAKFMGSFCNQRAMCQMNIQVSVFLMHLNAMLALKQQAA